MKALDLTIAIVLALSVLGAGYPVADAEESLRARPRLGMNLAGPADWNTELPFVDVFRLSRR